MPDLGGGKAPLFCLRISLEDDHAHDEATMVILPRRREPRESCEPAFRTRMVGPYRVRVLRCATIQDARDRASKWAGDMHQSKGYAAAVAVDRPTLPAPWASAQREDASKEDERGEARTVLAPMDAGDESVSLWLSSKHHSHMQVTLGEDDDDSLHVELLPSLLVLPEVGHVSDSENGRWKEEVSVRSSDSWLWSLSLEVLRLGGLESHHSTPLNWARSKAWSGALRPEARTKTRKGRLVSAGEYHVEVRERIATLSELGVLCRQGGGGEEGGVGGPGLRGDGAVAASDVGGVRELTEREIEREAEEKKFAELDAYKKHIAHELEADEARQRQIEGYEEDFEGGGDDDGEEAGSAAEEEEDVDGGEGGGPEGLASEACEDAGSVGGGRRKRAGNGVNVGGTRAIRTSYPIMDFSVCDLFYSWNLTFQTIPELLEAGS